jgi:hypothetical protein
VPIVSNPELESTRTCECDIRLRSACQGEEFYKRREGKRYCVLHYPGNEKSADFYTAFQTKLDNNDFNFRGVWFPDEAAFFSVEFIGNADFRFATFSAKADFTESNFRAEADFIGTTFAADAEFFNATFGDTISFANCIFSGNAQFSGTTFYSETDFEKVTFKALANFTACKFKGRVLLNDVTVGSETYFNLAKFDADVDFTAGTFSALASFSRADFSAATDFSNSTFIGGADFNHASFSGVANFSDCTFHKRAVFGNATFRSDVFFADTTFEAEASFTDAIFADYFRVSGGKGRPSFSATAELDLQFARFDKPEHVSFHTLRLRPYWFVNVDARKFDLTNVDWDWRNIKEEVQSLQSRQARSPLRLLAIACRHLAVNSEESQRYEHASRFRYTAMNARRRAEARGLACWKLSWWYWLASGYGERAMRGVLVLFGILLLSAVLYNHVGFVRWEPKLTSESDMVSAKRDNEGAPLTFSRALTYSAAVMTFQKPEPRPATTAAQTVVLLETILGPVQAALLALAIRRKFMR